MVTRMTKIAICYGTRYGTTTEVVQEMVKTAEELGASVEIVELKKKKKLADEIENYDLIVIGSGIQVGKWTKEPLEFMKKNIETLSKQKLALFVVSGEAGEPDKRDKAQVEYLDNVAAEYPELSSVSTGLFGGMFDFKRYNFATRAIIKKIVKSGLPEDEELPEVIDYRDWDQIRGWISDLLQ